MSKKNVVYAIIVVLVFVAGIALGIKINSGIKPSNGGEDAFKAGWNAARERLIENGIGTPESKTGVGMVSGTVEEITGNTITLLYDFSSDPLADSSLSTRMVNVDKNTKVYRLSQKDPGQIKKEREDSNVVKKNGYPSPYYKEEITFSGIKNGQFLMVMSGSDLKDKKEFLASEINVF